MEGIGVEGAETMVCEMEVGGSVCVNTKPRAAVPEIVLVAASCV